MKVIYVIALLIVCLGVPVGLWEAASALPPHIGTTPNLSYAETVTILLTGVTVVLAALTILVGVLAIVGYEGIKAEARAVAAKAVEKAVDDAIRKNVDDAAIRRAIRNEVARVREATRKETENEEALRYATAFSEGSETPKTSTSIGGRVGKEYPKSDNEG